MIVECSNCGKKFQRRPSHIHGHNYCSRRCHYEHSRKIGIWKAKKCENCGAPIRKGRKFCSLSCYFRYMWATKWKDKKTGRYVPSRKRFVTIVLRVPQISLTDFELALREMIRQYNSHNRKLLGEVRINIIGERRLIPVQES